jgi:hypothetical protein
VFLEVPVQLPEMLLLPGFARGEASIVLTIDPATSLQLAKKKEKKWQLRALSHHHDVVP